MIYEVREYVAVPGRFPALLEMFNDNAMRLFKRHGMDLVAVGMNWVGDNSFNGLVYTMRFDDAADLERKWASYLGDPEFVAALAANEADGPVVHSMKRRLLDHGPFADKFGEIFG